MHPGKPSDIKPAMYLRYKYLAPAFCRVQWQTVLHWILKCEQLGVGREDFIVFTCSATLSTWLVRNALSESLPPLWVCILRN